MDQGDSAGLARARSPAAPRTALLVRGSGPRDRDGRGPRPGGGEGTPERPRGRSCLAAGAGRARRRERPRGGTLRPADARRDRRRARLRRGRQPAKEGGSGPRPVRVRFHATLVPRRDGGDRERRRRRASARSVSLRPVGKDGGGPAERGAATRSGGAVRRRGAPALHGPPAGAGARAANRWALVAEIEPGGLFAELSGCGRRGILPAGRSGAMGSAAGGDRPGLSRQARSPSPRGTARPLARGAFSSRAGGTTRRALRPGGATWRSRPSSWSRAAAALWPSPTPPRPVGGRSATHASSWRSSAS